MRLLIVDDEPYTRDGLSGLVAESALPFDEVATAPGADAALVAVRASPPDVMLCDVRMPGTDGLTLARAVREIHPACRILIMSAYTDREYLKSAMNLQASAFIDKPVDEDELIAALARAARESEAARKEVDTLRALRGEELARAILRGETDGDSLRAFLGADGDEVCRCVLILPAYTYRADTLAKLQGYGARGVCATDGEGADALFIWHRPGNTLRDLAAFLTAKDDGTRVAIGRAISKPAALLSSYRSAKGALSTLFYRPALRYAFSAGDARTALTMLPSASEFERALLSGEQEAAAYLESLRNALLDAPYTPPDLARTHYHTLLSLALKDHAGLIGSVLEKNDMKSLWDACMGAASLDDLELLVWSALDEMARLRREDSETPSYAVSAARRYIHRSFHRESLQIREIADDAHMSVGHLGALFKRETGFTLRQYITHCRVREACRLLKETNGRNLDIARQVGYGDAYYFSQVFRRETGMSPQQYRKSG